MNAPFVIRLITDAFLGVVAGLGLFFGWTGWRQARAVELRTKWLLENFEAKVHALEDTVDDIRDGGYLTAIDREEADEP